MHFAIKTDPTTSRRSDTGLNLIILVLAAGAITLPFIFKAFHQDDVIFIRLAQDMLQNPLAPGIPDYGFGSSFYTVFYDTHPPLVPGYIALLIKLLGGAPEAGLHLGFFIFPALAAVSMYILARRFTGSPLTAALLLVCSPGFMVMSQSLMTDIPALSFWLAAIAAYVHAVDQDNSRLRGLAALFLALAILTTYQSFSLLLLVLLYAFLRRRVTVANLLPLGAGLVCFAAVFLFYFLTTGGPPKLSYNYGVIMTPTFLARKMLASASVIGGAVIFSPLMVIGLLKGRRQYMLMATVTGSLLFLYLFVATGYTTASAVLQAVFYSTGILAIYRFIEAGVDAVFSKKWNDSDRDTIFLMLWMGGVLVYCMLLLPYASTRYLLPLFPPVVIMFTRFALSVFPGRGHWQRFAVAVVISTAILGLTVSLADYRHAATYREFAAENTARLQAGGDKLCFAGEFGLRYYLEESGASYLSPIDNSPTSGDYVVLGRDTLSQFVSSELRDRLELTESIDYGSVLPVRTFNPASQAGFYAHLTGNLPYSFSDNPVETINIYKVR